MEFRLIGSAEPNEGRLEVQINSTWYGICKDSIDPQHASILCRDLGWWSACDRRSVSDIMVVPGSTTDAEILTLTGSCRPRDGTIINRNGSSLWNCDDVSFSNAKDLCKAGDETWLVCLAGKMIKQFHFV